MPAETEVPPSYLAKHFTEPYDPKPQPVIRCEHSLFCSGFVTKCPSSANTDTEYPSLDASRCHTQFAHPAVNCLLAYPLDLRERFC